MIFAKYRVNMGLGKLKNVVPPPLDHPRDPFQGKYHPGAVQRLYGDWTVSPWPALHAALNKVDQLWCHRAAESCQQ